MQNAAGALSYTIDLWSSKNRTSYLCITVHYLAYEDPIKKENLSLRSSILAFHPMYGKHTGQNIAETVTRLLVRAGIDPKKVRQSSFSLREWIN